MSSSNPPTYEEAIKELNALKAKGISTNDLAKAHSAMAKAASSSSTQREVLAQIKELAARAIEMDKSFERIRVDLGKVDAAEYLDKNGDPIEKLQPTWAGFQHRFTSLLWGSREAATKVESHIKDFVQVIIPEVKDPNSPLNDKKAEIRQFITRRNPSGSNIGIGSASQQFESLRNDVEVFTQKFLAFAKDRDVALTAQIKSLNGRIAELDKEIKASEQVIIEMSVALGLTAVGAVVGSIVAVYALGPAAPAAVVTILVAGLGAMIGETAKLISAINASVDARSERYDKQAEVDKLNKQLEVLQGLKSALERVDQDVKQVYSRLDDFSKIWDMVNQDAELIGEYLANSSTGKLDDSMLWKVELMESTYKLLGVGLREYAVLVDQSDIVKS